MVFSPITEVEQTEFSSIYGHANSLFSLGLLMGRVTSSLRLPRTVVILSLRISHPQETLSLGQTRIVGCSIRLVRQKCLLKTYYVPGFRFTELSKTHTVPAFLQLRKPQLVHPYHLEIQPGWVSRQGRLGFDHGVECILKFYFLIGYHCDAGKSSQFL